MRKTETVSIWRRSAAWRRKTSIRFLSCQIIDNKGCQDQNDDTQAKAEQVTTAYSVRIMSSRMEITRLMMPDLQKAGFGMN